MRVLHADSIRKTFTGGNVLNDIFISCDEGEIIGLLGRNGSGKSTLLKIIFGSLKAENKFVSVDQKKVGSLYSTRYLIKYLPQEHYMPTHKKIGETISCFCPDDTEIRNHHFVKPFLGKRVHLLSGGENRMIEILLMVYSNAKILLLDEPFNGISPINIDEIKTIIKHHSKHRAIVITDHDYRNVISMASKLVLMQNGNTKVIKEWTELVDLGYLPESAKELLMNSGSFDDRNG